MSEEEKKDLGDKTREAFDQAKEEARESSREFGEDSRKFSEDAKKAANEFHEDAKSAFSPDNPNSGNTVAIIAHLTLIGWIVALVMNNGNKTAVGSFYIRQVLGIFLIGFVLSFIPIVNIIAWIFTLILWVMSLIGAINGSLKPIFLVGEHFQNWFKSL